MRIISKSFDLLTRGQKIVFFSERWQVLIASVNSKGSLYRLVMVKRCRKTVYYVNHFNTVGFVGSVSFSTLCSAYKYFKQLNSNKKHKSITHQNQVALW